MARQRKPQHGESFVIRNRGCAELFLVGRGANLQLVSDQTSCARPRVIQSFSGPKTLRALAKAILKEVGDDDA